MGLLEVPYNENGDKIEVTGGRLKGLAKAGLITPGTLVETEDGKKAPAKKVKGLTFLASSQPETAVPELATLESAAPGTEIYGLSQAKPPAEEQTQTVPVPEEINPFAAAMLVEENPFASPTHANPFAPPSMGQYQSAPYQPAQRDGGSGSTASVVLGCIGLLAWLIPLFGCPITITGLILGIKGNSKPGTILCAIGLFLTIIIRLVA